MTVDTAPARPAAQPAPSAPAAGRRRIRPGRLGVHAFLMAVSLAFLAADGKQKGRAEEPVRCQTAFGGDTGFLCGGGHWHRPYDAPLSRSYSMRSAASTASFDSLDTEELMARMHAEEGVYGW